MARDQTTGVFTRTSNSFSNPSSGVVISPTDADTYMDDVDSGLTFNDTSPLIVIGSSSGITKIKASATASGTITIPAATDTLVGKATTDTLTNKTLTSPTLTSPTLTTPVLGTPSSGTLTSCTGLPISTGVSGLGTGIATALAVNTGSAGAPVLFNGALGTPSGGTLTSCTGLPISTGVSGLGAGVATFLATPSSANFAAAITDEDGTGVVPLESSGTWTPSDQSGASLSFTPANCTYNRIGNMVFVRGKITFPVTANASAVTIGGLPVAVPAGNDLPFAIKASSGGIGAVVGELVGGSSNFKIWGNGAVSYVNNNSVSGATLTVNVQYPAT